MPYLLPGCFADVDVLTSFFAELLPPLSPKPPKLILTARSRLKHYGTALAADALQHHAHMDVTEA